MRGVIKTKITRDILRELSWRGFCGVVFDTDCPGFFARMVKENSKTDVFWFVRVKGRNGKKRTLSLCCGCGLGSGGYSPYEARHLAWEYHRIYGDSKSKPCSCGLYVEMRSGRSVCIQCEMFFRYKRLKRIRHGLLANSLYALKVVNKEMRA